MRVAGWREVPVNESACGPIGLASLPRIEQIFVCPAVTMNQGSFQRALFLARRRAEMRLADLEDFYVVSLSPWIGQWHPIVQLVFYVAAGVVWLWVLPMRRMLSWMETGRWRKDRETR